MFMTRATDCVQQEKKVGEGAHAQQDVGLLFSFLSHSCVFVILQLLYVTAVLL